MRRVFLILALLDLAIVGWAFYDEIETRRPWKAIQAEWNALLVSRGQPSEPIAIRQVTNPELGLIDRCQTCHLASQRDGFGQDVPVHLRSHPRRAELLTAHAPDRFGCTTCHQGQGTQTKGVAGAPFAHGFDDHYWEQSLLRGPMVEATCLDCHEDIPSAAPALARGRRLFEDLGCHGCHTVKNLRPRAGALAPPLTRVRRKMSQAFFEEWIRDPRAIRRDTRMPSFWPVPLDPTTGLRTTDRAVLARWDQEATRAAKSIAAFLSSSPEEPDYPPLSFDPNDPGLASEGRALFDRVGCRGCHRLTPDEVLPGEDSLAPEELGFGPSLSSVGEKATAVWLAAWLRDPKVVWAQARMPSLRLTEPEIERLVAFLVGLRREGRPAASDAWAPSDTSLAEAGRKAVLLLGCAGCHEVPGVAPHGRPGPELESFGDKARDEISLGDAVIDCSTGTSTATVLRWGELECYTRNKIRTPRLFEGRSNPTLVMPDYGLADSEVEALTVFVLSNRDRVVAPGYQRRLTDRERTLATGERLITAFNCRGCHEIGRVAVRDVDGELSQAPLGGHYRAFTSEGLAPPPLTHAGLKLQYAWLWSFLREPTPVRPYLSVRMPTFGLSAAEIDALARYFAALDDEPYPVQSLTMTKFGEGERVEAERLFEVLKCRSCHESTGAQEDLAPDLAQAPLRLKPTWLRRWLEDPQALQPDTRMPTYFPSGDDPKVRDGVPGFFEGSAERQIEALVKVVLSANASN